MPASQHPLRSRSRRRSPRRRPQRRDAARSQAAAGDPHRMRCARSDASRARGSRANAARGRRIRRRRHRLALPRPASAARAGRGCSTATSRCESTLLDDSDRERRLRAGVRDARPERLRGGALVVAASAPSGATLRGGVGLGILASIGAVALGSLRPCTAGSTTRRRSPCAATRRCIARCARPGPFGQTFGVIGAVLMLVPFLLHGAQAAAPSRTRRPSCSGWLEVHLFCGIVGPVLVTFHTSFKFNGIVSAAYWSMMIVMLSGFVGPLSLRADSAHAFAAPS